MKNCKAFEKQLIAYLHGELTDHDFRILEVHLDGCAACRAALEAQRATLELLGTALETASAPEKLTARRTLPHRVSVPRTTFANYWFSPQFKAVCIAGVFASLFVVLSGTLVVFTVVEKGEASFEAKTVTRPKLPAKKLQVPVNAPHSKPKPKHRKRIVSKGGASYESEIRMPEITGMKGEQGNMGGDGLGSLGFDMAEVDAKWSSGSSASAPASLKMKKPSKPKSTAKITAVVPKLDLHDIQFPDLASSGRAAGLGVGSDMEWKMEISKREVAADKLGVEFRIDHLKSLSIKEPVPERLSQRKPAGFNPYVLVAENAFSTFSIDVDTAAYGLARQQLFAGGLPVPETVRTEEFINSFDYDYRPPAGKQTFAVHSEMAPSPFRTGMDLLKVGIKGYRIGRDDHRGAVLTLVIDTSGSMSTPERIGLVKKSLALLLDGLGPEDEVALVQFGGEARLVLEHTPLVQKAELLKAIAKLQPGGPTQFDAGLELGYAMATAGFKAGASNRIIIMSDGVANVGELDPEAMLQKVGEHRRKGIYLSVLGFGAGTYDDDLMERLANRGDGMYAYIDTLGEARRLLVDRLAATLHVIASDVKIQIEFNPDRVLRYRQLGYENRQLTKEQFRDDTVDAGEVGSGQAVTALYDLELDPNSESRDPIATVYVRYRRADTGAIEEISSRVTDSVRRKRFADADARFQLAACTAEFAERLRRSPYADGTEMADILGKLQPVAAELDLDAQVQELLRLILIADGLGK